MNKTDYRTEGQRARAERDAAICKEFKAIRKEQPLVTRNRVILKLAKDYGLVGQTVKVILRRNNAYN